MTKKNGFTLIELITVVVIIGILAGVTINVVNIKRIQQRSRDARRIGDLKKIQTALELYFADTRTYLPSTSWVDINSATNIVKTALISPSNVYIDRMPTDPFEDKTSEIADMTCHGTRLHGYYYISTGGKYVLNTIMETTENADDSLCSELPNCTDGSISCGSTSSYCYCVQNPM